ncbi:MAG: hypothetical protein E6G66_06625 [Actinobacteria bacterium]|nr:MAG: hypothetical protein E6G66_06625 [Actinomycetota bacterium]
MAHRWAGRRIRRPVSVPLLVLVAATGTAFVGTPAAEAAAHTVTGVVAVPASLTVGNSVQLTATLDSVPQLGFDSDVTVSFSIISAGGNAGTSIGSCVVKAVLLGLGGKTCSTSYVGTVSGMDTILAQAGAGDTGQTTTVTWQGIPAAITMNPGVSYNSSGQTANVVATVFDRQGKPVQGATVAFTVTGPGATSGSQTTDSSGAATFSFSSSATGQSSITATVTVGSGSITGNAAANWAGPPSQVTLGLFGATQSSGGLAPVKGTATVAAAVTDSGGVPIADNTPVTFTVTGAGATTGSASTSEGKAVFSFGAAVTGTSVVTASAPPAPTSNSVTVTWQTPVATTVTLAPKQTRAVAGANQILVATVTDQLCWRRYDYCLCRSPGFRQPRPGGPHGHRERLLAEPPGQRVLAGGVGWRDLHVRAVRLV